MAVNEGVVKFPPVVSALPPDAAANQLITPSLAAVSATVPGPQREVLDAVIVGMGLIVATTGVRLTDEHPFATASAKKVVVAVSEGVVKLLVPTALPPLAAANQLMPPSSLSVAVSVTVPVPHRVAGVVEVTVGIALMIAATGTRVIAGQPAMPVNSA